MKQLTNRERELVALGAALGSNCIPCMEHHIPLAAQAGLGAEEISEALALADQVRQVPARKVLEEATKLVAAGAPPKAQTCSAEAARCCG